MLCFKQRTGYSRGQSLCTAQARRRAGAKHRSPRQRQEGGQHHKIDQQKKISNAYRGSARKAGSKVPSTTVGDST